MEKIASFTVNHLALEPGVYVSRVDADPATGAVVTTFDLRLTAPNREPVMDTAAVHAIEHLGATYVRNDPAWTSRVVYFGPMGCRTGFYLVVFGTPLPRWRRSCARPSSSFATSRARFPARVPRSAATGTMRTLRRRAGGRAVTSRRRSR